MEGNYQPGFYTTEREQDSRQPSLPLQQQHQQQQQHAAHYPLELPIPYHTTSQHQSEFVVDQPLRTFPIPHPAAHMLTSIYHDSGPVLPNSNILHHAHQHPSVTFGGHGVKSSVNHAPPITTREPGRERNTLPIATREPVIERNIPPITTPEPVVESNIQPITTQEPRAQSNIQPITTQEPGAQSNIQPITTREPGAQSNPSQPKGQTPNTAGPSNQVQSVEQTEQRPSSTESMQQLSSSPPAPSTSSEEPQLLAALNLKKTSFVRDLPLSLSCRVTSEDKVEGVVAKETIEKGVEFGPYTGTLVDEDFGWSKETSWEVCMSDRVFYIDGNKTWMSYLRCAQSEEEQNMEAYQYYGKIYFKSTKVIEPGSELRVCYSEEYGKHIGVKTRLKDLIFDQDAQKFQCNLCEALFTSVKLILRHIRCEHINCNPDEMIPVLTWKKKKKKKYVEPEVRSNKQFKTKRKVLDQGESIFKCETCEKIFPSFGRLKAHELFHIMMDESKPFECSECNQRYTAQSSLNRHEREAHGIFQDYIPRRRGPTGNKTQMSRSKHKVKLGSKPYECRECDQSYKSLPSLKRHEREAHEVLYDNIPRRRGPAGSKTAQSLSKHKEKHESKPYECSECSHMCKSLVMLKKHVRVAHGYQCQFCFKRFSKKGDRTKHERTHQVYNFSHSNIDILESEAAPNEPKDMLGKTSNYYQRLYKCRFCPKRYSSRTGIEQHEKEVHMGADTFKCTYCPKGFASKSRLKEHLVMHKYVHIHRCTLCPRTFASESALNNHQGEHTGLKPVPCEICGRGFRTRKLVLNHKQRMHQERPKRFICSICNKGFAEKSHLKVHERRHKGIRQFVCLECGKGFTAKHTLTAHTQTMHTKERPFSCQICNKTFSLNHHLNHHIAKHHMAKQRLEEDGSSSIQQ